MKIVRAVLDVCDSCVHGQIDRQTDNPIFCHVETCLDRLLVTEIHIIPNFVKIVRAVVENVNTLYIPSYLHIYCYEFVNIV